MSRMVMLVTILIQSLLTGRQIFPTSQVDTLNRVGPLLNLADAYIVRGDLTEASPLVIQAEAIAPFLEPVQLKRAEILARQGDIEHASQVYERLNSKSPAVSLAYAQFLRQIDQTERAIAVIGPACDAIDFIHRYDALKFRVELLIEARQFDFTARDLTKLTRMKTESPEIQLLQVEVELKRGLTERVLQIYRTLPVIVKTSANAERLKMKFRRIRNRLKLIGQDFGPYDF